MLHKAWNSKGEMPYRFPRSSVKFQGHTVQNITDFDPNWAFPDYRPVAAFKSLRFALFSIKSFYDQRNMIDHKRSSLPVARSPLPVRKNAWKQELLHLLQRLNWKTSARYSQTSMNNTQFKIVAQHKEIRRLWNIQRCDLLNSDHFLTNADWKTQWNTGHRDKLMRQLRGKTDYKYIYVHADIMGSPCDI